MTRTLVFSLLILASTNALAQVGFMRNISASGLVINDPPNTVVAQIACTIVDQGSIGLIIFAEANNSDTDPEVVLVQLINGGQETQASNDDWVTLSSAERNAITSALRAPNRNTDSALIGVAEPGSYCAFAFQVGFAEVGSVNLQITDVSEQILNKDTLSVPNFEPISDPALEARIQQALEGLPPLLP